MKIPMRNLVLFGGVAVLLILEGTVQNGFFSGSWNSSLVILNMALISAVMALGVNMQWGYAGLFNTGIVGFVAFGGLAPVLVSIPPVAGAWVPGGGPRVIAGLVLGAAIIALAVMIYARMAGRRRIAAMIAVLVGGFFLYRAVIDPAITLIETNDPAAFGNIGGLGLPALISWPVGGLMAAGAAWVIGKTALGLRSDYLAIATLGIGEIIIAVLKNEDWLARGVKNMTGIPRPWPVPREVDLQQDPGFLHWVASMGWDPVTASTIVVKLLFCMLFALVLLGLIWGTELALKSPWGRMMRAIRDNETAARAMGKNVTRRHLQIFVLGSAICGLAGAMMVTLDGQLTPGTYSPMRFTFLIWLMVIVGGSGNNWGAVLGSFLIWFLWIKVEVWGPEVISHVTASLPADSVIRQHLADSAAHMRLVVMGVILLLVLRFSPRGLIPEK